MSSRPMWLICLLLSLSATVLPPLGCRSRSSQQHSKAYGSTSNTVAPLKPQTTSLDRPVPSPPCAPAEVHYSPDEDLEQLDSELLDRAKHDIDISAYSFTDPEIALVLEKKANEGIRIRMYSDRSSARAEITRAKGDEAIIVHLSHIPNIEVRVKRSSQLAHMKAYEVDGAVLRTGSANFSQRAEEKQDNDLLIIRDPASVTAYHSKFEAMWARQDNERLE